MCAQANMGQIEVLEEDNDSRRSMKKRGLTYNLLNYHSFHEDSIELNGNEVTTFIHQLPFTSLW
jgi:hypothetical protein